MSEVLMRPAAARLLKAHRCEGVRVEDMIAMMGDCEQRVLRDGQPLCTEGEDGESLFILLQGKVKVLKKDPRGHDRELTVLKAPALLGHMSLVDGSPRSATCLAQGPVQLVEMSQRVYQFRIGEIGPPGTALRRLLLSSLTQQLVRGNAHLDALLSPDLPEDGSTEEEDQEAVMKASGILGGWGDPELDEMLESMELVETEDDRRARLDPKRRW